MARKRRNRQTATAGREPAATPARRPSGAQDGHPPAGSPTPAAAAPPGQGPPPTLPPVAAAIAARPALWTALILLLLTAGLYYPLSQFGFIAYQDPLYVTANPLVAGGVSIDGIAWAWTGLHQGLWHPLTTLSHMLDAQLFGLRGERHHLGNLFLHVLNSLLLFAILSRNSGQPWRSACVAVLFAVHPVQVEAVAWVSERKTVLSGCFFLLTLWSYGRYVRRPDARQYALLLSAGAAAMLSSPTAVGLPVALLLFDVWPLGRWRVPGDGPATTLATGEDGDPAAPGDPQPSPATLILEKLPLIVLAAGIVLVTYVAQSRSGALVSFGQSPFGERLANALVAYVVHIGQALWPTRLAVFYPFEAPLPAWQVLGSAGTLIAMTVLVVRAARAHPYLCTGWGWYLGLLFPVIGMVRTGGHAMSDHNVYLPLIGLLIMVAWGAPAAIQFALRARKPAARIETAQRVRTQGMILALIAGMAIVVCAGLTARQVRVWQDSRTLFTHALAVTHDNYLAHFMVGSLALQDGRRDQAYTHFAETVRLEPAYVRPCLGSSSRGLQPVPCRPLAEYNMGTIRNAQGDREAAARHYLAAIDAFPAYADAHNSVGIILDGQGQTEEAMRHFREATIIDPAFVAAHNNLAATLAKLGRTDEAIEHYAAALRGAPERAEPYWNLAVALQSAGRSAEAVEHFRTAVHFNPSLVEMRQRLAAAYVETGQIAAAQAELEEILRQRPQWPAAEALLAWLLATADEAQWRDGPRAVQLAENAAQRTQRADPEALKSLAAAYAEVERYGDAATVAAEAIEAARKTGQPTLATTLDGHLQQYRSKQPVRTGGAAPQP